MPRRKHSSDENVAAKNFITWLIFVLMGGIILWFLISGLMHYHSLE